MKKTKRSPSAVAHVLVEDTKYPDLNREEVEANAEGVKAIALTSALEQHLKKIAANVEGHACPPEKPRSQCLLCTLDWISTDWGPMVARIEQDLGSFVIGYGEAEVIRDKILSLIDGDDDDHKPLPKKG